MPTKMSSLQSKIVGYVVDYKLANCIEAMFKSMIDEVKAIDPAKSERLLQIIKEDAPDVVEKVFEEYFKITEEHQRLQS